MKAIQRLLALAGMSGTGFGELMPVSYPTQRRGKRNKGHGPKYKPGTLGLSAVSAANLKDHGVILSRRERRQAAKRTGRPMRKYINS